MKLTSSADMNDTTCDDLNDVHGTKDETTKICVGSFNKEDCKSRYVSVTSACGLN